MAVRGSVGAGALTCWQRILVSILATKDIAGGMTHEGAFLFLLSWPNPSETLN